MAGVTAQGGTLTFGTSLTVTATVVSVEEPKAEIVDMTPAQSMSPASVVLVPTGAWSGGGVGVEYIRSPSAPDPRSFVKKVGPLTFSSPGFSVTRQAVMESASAEARVGDVVRGTIRFVLTDHTASDV